MNNFIIKKLFDSIIQVLYLSERCFITFSPCLQLAACLHFFLCLFLQAMFLHILSQSSVKCLSLHLSLYLQNPIFWYLQTFSELISEIVKWTERTVFDDLLWRWSGLVWKQDCSAQLILPAWPLVIDQPGWSLKGFKSRSFCNFAGHVSSFLPKPLKTTLLVPVPWDLFLHMLPGLQLPALIRLTNSFSPASLWLAPPQEWIEPSEETAPLRWWLIYFFHYSNLYTLPFCSLGHAISKNCFSFFSSPSTFSVGKVLLL